MLSEMVDVRPLVVHSQARFPMFAHLSRVFFSVTFLFSTGCSPAFFMDDDTAQDGYGESDRGGGLGAIHLPFAQGGTSQCVQGVYGSYSHDFLSTMYDLDFDTSNTGDEEVYAPVSGTVHVHMESATTNFGYHVNIDLGDGTYVMLGHFSDIFVLDGDEVTAGQLLGYEGCTGSCTGDHVHMGLHEGDAQDEAHYGVSIPAEYYLADATSDGSYETIPSEDMICGIRSEGDPQEGHTYRSALPVSLWHPNGALVKTGDNAKTYLIEDGKARWIETQDIFWSHGYDFANVSTISDEELACLGEGEVLDDAGYVEAFLDDEDDIWLFVDTGNEQFRIWVREESWEVVLTSWGLRYTQSDPPAHLQSSDSLWTSYTLASGYAELREGSLVKESDASDVYFVTEGIALPIVDWSIYLLMGFYVHELIILEPGELVGIQEDVGSCRAGVWCLDEEAITTCGGGLDLGSGGDYGGDEEDEEDPPEDEEEEEDEEDPPEDEEEDEDPPEDEEEDEDLPEDEEDDDPPEYDDEDTGGTDTGFEYDDSNPCDGDDACVEDMDGDGMDETLMMADDVWLTSWIDGEPAYVYANAAGCFDGTLGVADLFESDPSTGYYLMDFSSFVAGCTSELSLISSVGTDGNDPQSDMSNWYWWQNADFCSQGQDLCELENNGTSWEEWLIRVSWIPSYGLLADGNGYTSNDEL